MKKHRYEWWIGLCLLVIVSIFSQTTTAYADTTTSWNPYGDNSFTMDISFEDGTDVETLSETELGNVERKFSCFTSNFTGEKCEVSISSSNSDVIELSESFSASNSYKGNKNFSYTVIGYGKTSLIFQVGNYKMEKVICVVPDKVDLKEVKQDGEDTISLTWNKVDGMTGYIIEQSLVGGEYKEIATVVKNTNTTSIKVAWDTQYLYRVIPYIQNGDKKVYGGNTGKSLACTVTNPAAKIKTVKPYKDDYLKITWTKCKIATGYKLYRSEKKDSDYKCVYTAKSNKTTSWKQKVTKGKKYYYRIVTIYKDKKSDPSVSVPQILPKMELDRTKTNLRVGKTTELEMKGTSKKVTWSSSNKKVATVNKKGVVTGKKVGTTTITAKVGKKKFKCKVSVVKAYLSAEKVTIYAGDSTEITLRGTEVKSLKSSNKKVATVKKTGSSGSGVWITAKKAGKATITIKGKDGKSYKCKVTVKKKKTIKNKNQTVTWQQNGVYLEHIGIFIPRLKEFNEAGLISNNRSWVGPIEDTKNPSKTILSNMNQIYYTFDNVAEALVAKGTSPESSNYFTINYAGWILYSWAGADNPHFQLLQLSNKGCYRLDIGLSLEDAPYWKYNLADWNKDIVKTLLSLISSEPEEVFDAIYECLYEDMYVLSTTEYTKVGDCEIRMDPRYSFRENGYCTVSFYIRPQ